MSFVFFPRQRLNQEENKGNRALDGLVRSLQRAAKVVAHPVWQDIGGVMYERRRFGERHPYIRAVFNTWEYAAVTLRTDEQVNLSGEGEMGWTAPYPLVRELGDVSATGGSPPCSLGLGSAGGGVQGWVALRSQPASNWSHAPSAQVSACDGQTRPNACPSAIREGGECVVDNSILLDACHSLGG